jgi:hypothetical protein
VRSGVGIDGCSGVCLGAKENELARTCSSTTLCASATFGTGAALGTGATFGAGSTLVSALAL